MGATIYYESMFFYDSQIDVYCVLGGFGGYTTLDVWLTNRYDFTIRYPHGTYIIVIYITCVVEFRCL